MAIEWGQIAPSHIEAISASDRLGGSEPKVDAEGVVATSCGKDKVGARNVQGLSSLRVQQANDTESCPCGGIKLQPRPGVDLEERGAISIGEILNERRGFNDLFVDADDASRA